MASFWGDKRKLKIDIDDDDVNEDLIYVTDYNWIAQIVFDCCEITGLLIVILGILLGSVYFGYLGILIEFIPDPTSSIANMIFGDKQRASSVSQCQALNINVCSKTITNISIKQVFN